MQAAVVDRDTRLALKLNLGCDLGDGIATLLEWRTGGLHSRLGVASVVLQSVGLATWSTALRNI